MEKYLEMYDKNQEIVGGEEFIYNGKTHYVEGMTDEEIDEMRQEGLEIGNIEIDLLTPNGPEKIKLIDMQDGRKLFKRIDSLNLDNDTNFNAFWYVWREARMEERFNRLSEKAQAKIIDILED